LHLITRPKKKRKSPKLAKDPHTCLREPRPIIIIMLSTVATLLLLAVGAQALVPRACTYSVTAQVGSTCASIARDWGITAEAFKSYNPTVTDCSKLTPGASYCIDWEGALPGQTSSTSTTTTNRTPTTTTTTKVATTTTTAPSGPSPTQAGIIKTCANLL
jgi:hypothetical protein